MYKLLASCLLALPLLALPSRACAGNFGVGPITVDAGFKYHLDVTYDCNSVGCLHNVPWYGNSGPWYLYWPSEAHSQSLAPMPFPYWPSVQATPAGPAQAASTYYGGNSGNRTVASYYYARTTPNYWYGH
jgi:hypothetical protein